MITIKNIAARALLISAGAVFYSNSAWALLPIQHWTEGNGAKVYLVESPVIPMVDVQIDFDAGSRRDPAGQSGLASAVAAMASKGVKAGRDTSTEPALDENGLGEAWADLGASFEVAADNDRLQYSLRSLTDPPLLDKAARLAARQIGEPSFPADVWPRDRARWSASIKESLTRPATVANHAFEAAVYGSHPYGVQTTAETLARISVADMQAFHTQHIGACRAKVSIVGAVPQGLPTLAFPPVAASAIGQLWLPALLISLVGFVESVSVAQSLALKRQQRIQPNRELLGLGAANVASALSGGFPVTGGFARSVVNFSAGANTPLAGVVSAMLMAVVIAALTGLFYYLPHAVLAATIIVAVVSLIDVQTLREAWCYDKADAWSLLATAGGVIVWGVEVGILMGVGLSLGTLVWRSSHPHIAVVGRVPGTEHFRNIARHPVATEPDLIAVRVDESLYFANSEVLQDSIESLVAAQPRTRHVLLVCSAINQIDATALGVLTDLESSLARRGIALLLSEVKGPVLDRLQKTSLGQNLQGRVFLSTHQAFESVRQNTAAPMAGSEKQVVPSL